MKKTVIGAGIVGLVVVVLLIALLVGGRTGPQINGYAHGGTGKVVGIINIQGTIMGGSQGGIWAEGAGSNDIMKKLRQAMNDPSIGAVVLRLDSPGGSAGATQEIATEVERLRKSGKVVVASMGDTAASGAYWIASVCDVIVANPTTLTGSIGVRMDVTDLQGLYDKLGIETHTFKSGTMKDMGASDREITPEEQTVFQGIIDDMYGQFVDVVAEGRKMDRNAVLALADGRVFTGRQAKDLGLVDQLGNYYDAIRLAGERAGIGENPETTTFYEAGFWESIFSSKNTKLPALQPPILEDKDPSVWLKME